MIVYNKEDNVSKKQIGNRKSPKALHMLYIKNIQEYHRNNLILQFLTQDNYAYHQSMFKIYKYDDNGKIEISFNDARELMLKNTYLNR